LICLRSRQDCCRNLTQPAQLCIGVFADATLGLLEKPLIVGGFPRCDPSGGATQAGTEWWGELQVEAVLFDFAVQAGEAHPQPLGRFALVGALPEHPAEVQPLVVPQRRPQIVGIGK
jgi:hypothetical protein